MKAIKNLSLAMLPLMLWQCGFQNEIATNYYSDGIYYDPSYGSLLVASDSDSQEQEEDYYQPGTYVQDPGSFGSGWNSTFYSGIGINYMYSPWGYGSMMNFGMGAGWGNPYTMGMYDMFYGYPAMGMYNPYFGGYPGFGMPYNPWGPMYGYNMGWMNPGFGYPYYPYGWYPSNGFGGSDYFMNPKAPDIVIRGSGPRGSRSNSGISGSGTRPMSKTGKVSNPDVTDQRPVLVGAPVERDARVESRLRQSPAGYSTTNRTVTNSDEVVRNVRNADGITSKPYYERVVGENRNTVNVDRNASNSYFNNRGATTAKPTRSGINYSSPSRIPANAPSKGSTLQRQTERVIKQSSPSRQIESSPSMRNTNPEPVQRYNPGTQGGSRMNSTPSGGSPMRSSGGGSGSMSRPSGSGATRK